MQVHLKAFEAVALSALETVMLSAPVNESMRIRVTTYDQIVVYSRSHSPTFVPKELVVLGRYANRAAVGLVGKFVVVFTSECNC